MSTETSRSDSPTGPIYPHPPFEEALVRRYSRRDDIQDYARLSFYVGFEPRVESYEGISNAELDEILSFLQSQDEQYKSTT